MRRRRFLLTAASAGAVTSGLAGCLAPPEADDGPPARDADGDAASAGTPTTPAAGIDADVDLPVERSALTRGAPRDAIPAITEPAFGPADAADLSAADPVIGVAREVDGERRARAYPLSVLGSHEVVNDAFGGPLLVTYCPICASAVTAERRVDDEATTFGVSGLLYNADLVMYDEATDSLWSQLLARAIRGSATGQRLSLVPSSVTSWAGWRREHPETRVLRSPPASETVPEPYDPGTGAGYGNRGAVGLAGPRGELGDDRLPATELVVGVATDAAARAYPVETVREAGVIEDRVGDLPVVLAADATAHAYDRRVDGDVLSFEPAGDGRLRAGGSVWSVVTGRALEGPYEGRRLRSVADTPLYWFAWVEFRPDTDVYGR